MKKILFAKRLPLTLLVPAIAACLLQSCCFLGPISTASQKPCNCGPANVAYTANSITNSHPGTRTIAAQTGSGMEDRANTSMALTEQNIQPLPVEESVVAADMANPEKLAAESLLLPVHTDNSLLSARSERSYTISPESNSNKGYAEKKMPLGIKAIKSYITAGPNISFKSSKENYGGTNHKSKPGVGFQLGFGTSYYFSNNFAVAPALLFKNNTATETISYATTGEPTYGGGGAGASHEYETKYSYSYLSVPILAEIKMNEQFTLMAGPEVNFLVSAQTKLKSEGNTEKTDIKSSSVKTGVGVQVGVKYTIPDTPVGIQLLYDHRISRLNEKNPEYYTGGGGSYETPAWNMKSIQLGITCALCELLKGGQK